MWYNNLKMGKILKSKKIIICLVILGIFMANSVVFALQVSWPKSPAGTELKDESTLPDLIKYLYEWGIFLGGLVAFIALIIAGFQYLTSVGDPARMKDAMDRIKSAFLGLILLLGSWLILNTISPQFTSFPPLEFKPPSEEAISPYETCGPNKPCSDPVNYECKNGYCIPKEPPTEPCEKVELSGGVTGIIKANEDTQKTIPTGTTFSSKSTPERCAGTLQLFGKISAGKCEDFRCPAGVNDKNISCDTDVKCVKLFAPEK